MSCEHLICAHCGGPVIEARCSACRSARAHVHHRGPLGNISPQLLVAAALILLLGLLLAAHVMP